MSKKNIKREIENIIDVLRKCMKRLELLRDIDENMKRVLSDNVVLVNLARVIEILEIELNNGEECE